MISIINKPFFKKTLTVSLALALLIITLFAAILLHVRYKTENLIYTENVPSKSVAIVFGAAVNPNILLPSDILADRIQTGVNLYKEGKVQKLIMSGDNRVTHYNEPEVMKKYAVNLGVPEDDIVLDYAGRRTYDTCYRARDIFGVEEAILVTQRYHLYRALYTCNALGVDSVGADSALQPYIYQSYYNLREIPATLLAVWQVYITKPVPILGESVEIF